MGLAERFWSKVEQRASDECWPWTRGKSGEYGSVGHVEVNGRVVTQVGAHRVAFYLTHGYWPRVARHTCHNPPCCNPGHIIDGTPKLNTGDMIEAGRAAWQKMTHCRNGHDWIPENIYTEPDGGQRCRPCARDTGRKWNATHPGANAAKVADWVRRNPERARENARRRQAAYRARKRQAETVS
jgi:hypothetical protein